MQMRECLRHVRPLLRERLTEDLGTFRWEASFLAKAWFGNHDLHYEITPRERAGMIEIGLHFEADPLTNARLLAAFRANAKTVRRTLTAARLEEWDRGWCRVWEPLPYREAGSMAREGARRSHRGLHHRARTDPAARAAERCRVGRAGSGPAARYGGAVPSSASSTTMKIVTRKIGIASSA
jgi:hypothetical protein